MPAKLHGSIRFNRKLLLIIVFAIVLFVGYKAAPYYSQSRLLTIGDSGSARVVAWRATLNAIPTHPLGIGWGNWAPFIGPNVTLNSLLYPHNLLLEAFLEGGWVAGFGLIWFVWRVIQAGIRVAAGPVGQAVFALFLFYLFNSMVSDDLIGARVFFAISALVLAYETIVRARAPSPQPTFSPIGWVNALPGTHAEVAVSGHAITPDVRRRPHGFDLLP